MDFEFLPPGSPDIALRCHIQGFGDSNLRFGDIVKSVQFKQNWVLFTFFASLCSEKIEYSQMPNTRRGPNKQGGLEKLS